MALLEPTCYPLSVYFNQQEAELQHLLEQSDAVAESQIEGKLVLFRVPDGYAYYLVTKEFPLTIQEVPYGDAYTIPAAWVRGLEREDLEEQLAIRRALQAARKSRTQVELEPN